MNALLPPLRWAVLTHIHSSPPSHTHLVTTVPPRATRPAATRRSRRHQSIPQLFYGGGDETLEDGSRYNPAVISFIRDEWIAKQMQERCVRGRGGACGVGPKRRGRR